MSQNLNITLVDTGKNNDWRKIKRISKYINNETFCFTYGDGVADVNITELISFHKNNSKATLTAVQPPGRFGSLEFERGKVLSFQEKPKGDGNWINGGFFVLEPEVFDYIDGDQSVWEQYPLKKLAENGELAAYHHNGFWQPMDTLKDKMYLDELWKDSKSPWKCWS